MSVNRTCGGAQIDAKAGSALAPSPAMFFEQEPEARATVESDVRALIAEQPRAVLEAMIVEYASTKRSVESRIRRAREQLGEAVAEPALRLPAPADGAAGPSTAPLVVAPPPTPAAKAAADNKSAQMNSQDDKFYKARGDAPAAAAAAAAAATQANQEAAKK